MSLGEVRGVSEDIYAYLQPDGSWYLNNTGFLVSRRGDAYNGGVGTAQRGWLTPDDVINAWPLDKLRAFLRKSR